MSLSAWERKALESIEVGLSGSDPGLTSMMATFTRLASAEKMPAREAVRPGPRRSARPRRRRRRRGDGAGLRARPLIERLGWPRVGLVLLWVMLTAWMVTVALILTAGGGRETRCSDAWPALCAVHGGHSPRPRPDVTVVPLAAARPAAHAGGP